jgi:hypothetical protein
VLDKAKEVLGVPKRSICRFVLKSMKWNKGEAVNALLENHPIIKGLGLEEMKQETGFSVDKSEARMCDICFDEGYLEGCGCGHWFCHECWQDHAWSQVSRQNWLVFCQGRGCKAVLEDVDVYNLFDKKKQKIYLSNLIDAFVAENRAIKFCPFGGCQGVVEMLDFGAGKNEAVECSECGTRFCFGCLKDPHLPASCSNADDFLSRRDGVESTEEMLKKVSRPCPSCGVLLFRDGGCLHMTCGSCGFHFCYACNEKFGSGPKGGSDGYGSHRCISDRIKELDSLEKASVSDSDFRFNWFCEKVNLYLESAEKGHGFMLRLPEEKIQDWELARKAMVCLYDMRQMIAFGFVAGYYRYLNSKIFLQLDIFEFCLQDLISLVDKAAEQVEERLKDDRPIHRPAVLTLIRSCRRAIFDFAEVCEDDTLDILEDAKPQQRKMTKKLRNKKNRK